MTRLLSTGFEFGDSLPIDTASGATIVTTAPRSGAYECFLFGNYANVTKNLVPAKTELYIRTGMKISPLVGPPAGSIEWLGSSGTALLGRVTWAWATGLLEVYVGAALVATGTHALIPGTYYLVEVHVKLDDTVGVIDVRLDGNTEATFNGDTIPAAVTTIDVVRWRNASVAGGWYIDDLAINDTAGGVDDSWCGDGHIVALMPDSAGDATGLTPVGAANNWDCVDERPPDGDTTYVQDSVLDIYDLYNCVASGLSSVQITRVWTESRSREVTATGGKLALGVKTHGVEYWSGDLPLITSYYRMVSGDWRVNPNTLIEWTVAELDALQAGVKVR